MHPFPVKCTLDLSEMIQSLFENGIGHHSQLPWHTFFFVN